jgi:hypothetical protein
LARGSPLPLAVIAGHVAHDLGLNAGVEVDLARKPT